MKGTLSLKLGVAVAGVLLAGSSFAQGFGSGGGGGFGDHRPPMERAMGGQGDRGRWWNNPKVVERLKLTDDQRKAMDAILLSHRDMKEPKRRERRDFFRSKEEAQRDSLSSHKISSSNIQSGKLSKRFPL